MEVDVKDLEKVLEHIKKDSTNVILKMRIEDHKLVIRYQDRYQVHAEIQIFKSGSLQPRIIKEEPL